MPSQLELAVLPLLECIEELNQRIYRFDRMAENLAKKKYSETEGLRVVGGVGAITALAFVLTLEDPKRFAKSDKVGAYVGLVPRQDETGESSPELRITKAGNPLLRRLLVGAAQYILGPFGADCDLRRFGEAIARRGGKNAKKRAVVAVARKLAELLHHLWLTGAVYEPLHNSARRMRQRRPQVSTSPR